MAFTVLKCENFHFLIQNNVQPADFRTQQVAM